MNTAPQWLEQNLIKVELIKDTLYFALTGELWGVFCKDLGENWPHYNSTALY